MGALKTTRYADLPSPRDVQLAKEASQALSGLIDGDSVVDITVNRGEAKIDAKIPAVVLQMIVELLAHMSQGKAVTVIPQGAEFTTQQAAHFLNVSRPYLIGLLENGDIPFHKTGRHRRIRFEDLLSYKTERNAGQSAALDELAALSQMAAKKAGKEY